MDIREPYIDVIVGNSKFQKVDGLYQYDHGINLRITGVSGHAFNVHFSAVGRKDAYSVVPTEDDGVYYAPIPDVLLMQDKCVQAYIYVEQGEDENSSGVTIFEVAMPLMPRQRPQDAAYTPQQIENYDTLVSELNDLIEDMESAMGHGPKIDEDDGHWYTWDDELGEYVDTGVEAQGPQGDDYVLTNQDKIDIGTEALDQLGLYVDDNGYVAQHISGEDEPATTIGERLASDDILSEVVEAINGMGYSPTATVSKTGSTATITITDKNGTTTAQISDGTNGTNGTDGFSPTATVTKSGTTATISITDKDGTTTATVSDGIVSIDDTAGVGDTDKAWSANKLAPIESDVSDLKSQIDTNAPAIWEDASGPVAHFEDGADDMPLKACTVQIMPVQAEGTPTPSDPLPISGWTGMNVSHTGTNLFDKTKITAGKYVNNVGGLSASANFNASDYTPIPRGASLYTVETSSFGSSYFAFYDASKAFISSEKQNLTSMHVTAPENAVYVRFCVHNDKLDVARLEVGHTVSEYAAYNGTNIPISFPAAAGTVYGGSLDLVRGKLTVTYIFRELDETENWTWDTQYTNPLVQVSSVFSKSQVKTSTQMVFSNQALFVRAENSNVAPGYFTLRSYGKDFRFGIDTSVFANLDAWLAHVEAHPIEVCVLLAEPIEYDIDPVILRTLASGHINNIWADTGDIAVTYPADTKLFIASQSDIVEQVSGTTPTITCEAGKRYVCGTVSTISITPPASGICDIVFTSGSTAAVLTVPNTIKWPSWFIPSALDKNTTYELSIMDGTLGAVGTWT